MRYGFIKISYILLLVPILLVLFAFQNEIRTLLSGRYTSLQDIAPVLHTEVIPYRPQTPDQTRQGYCVVNSLATSVDVAWSCIVDEVIYDPCIETENGKDIVCNAHPLSLEDMFTVELSEPLPTPLVPEDIHEAVYVVRLASGRVCTAVAPSEWEIDGELVTYVCESNSSSTDVVLIGPLKKGKLWHARRAVVNRDGNDTATQIGVAPIKTIWIVRS